MQHGFAQQTLGALVAEWHGPHVLIRLREEVPREQGSLSRSPAVDGQLFVLASPGAQAEPSLGTAISTLLRPLLPAGDAREVKSVWLGVPGLAADGELARRLSHELGVDVFAPDGAFAVEAGAARYAGHGFGGTGWWQFGAGRLARLAGTRHPRPAWESVLPVTPLVAEGVVAEPVPAGLLVRAEHARPVRTGDPAFGVVIDYRFPKLVVGGAGTVPAPGAVAGVVGRLALGPFMVVPETPEAASHTWQAELARQLSVGVVFSTGAQSASATGELSTYVLDSRGEQLFRPFPTVLRQPADGQGQQVLDIAPAPPGWVRCGPRTYRPAEGGGDFLAEVVPSGLVLRTPAEEPADGTVPFDPSQWTLYLGTPGEPVGLPLLIAAEQLLAGLEPEQRAVARVRATGLLDDRGKAALGLAASPAGAGLEVSPPEAGPERAGSLVSVLPVVSESTEGTGASEATEAVVAVEAPPVAARPERPAESGPAPSPAPAVKPPSFLSLAAPPIATMSGGPVSTVAGSPGRPVELSEPEAAGSTEIGGHAVVDTGLEQIGAVEPEAARLDVAEPASVQPVAAEVPAGPRPVPEFVEPQPAAPRADDPESPTETPPPDDSAQTGDAVPSAAEPAPAPAPAPGPAGRPFVITDRPSTAGEQARFTAAAGEAFGNALATVNAALATWPSMRHAGESDVKADYVAVCLYLGSGESGAIGVNGAVRMGQSGAVDGQLPCLVSGIRRLPTHRRAVLRQGKLGESIEQGSTPGAVFTEPGFLSASMDLDVTVPGADLDVLIWPNSARRTSELMMSRPANEAVFVAGARFKALAVRTAEDGEIPDDEGPAAPRIAVLFRELAPGETPDTAELDDRDLAVLAKLDRVLVHRQKSALRLVDDPDVAARLTSSMLEWHEEMLVAAARADRIAAAS